MRCRLSKFARFVWRRACRLEREVSINLSDRACVVLMGRVSSCTHPGTALSLVPASNRLAGTRQDTKTRIRNRKLQSEILNSKLEVKIEAVLTTSGITYRKTKRAERIPGFDQTADFIGPDEFAPKVVIAAKIAED